MKYQPTKWKPELRGRLRTLYNLTWAVYTGELVAICAVVVARTLRALLYGWF